MENLLEENKRLKKDIQELKSQLERIEENEKKSRKEKVWLSKKATSIFLGWRLKNSIKKLFREISEKNIRNETLADVTTHILWRFTRIGIFTLVFAILPTLLLIVQVFFTIQISLAANRLTANANELATYQNKLTSDQTYLINRQIEVEDYKQKVNFMNDLNELINNLNNDPSLGVINQIAYYSNNWTVRDSNEISNEKSILLTELSMKKISDEKLELIFSQSDFSNSIIEISNVNKKFIKLLKSQYGFSEFDSNSIQYITIKGKKEKTE